MKQTRGRQVDGNRQEAAQGSNLQNHSAPSDPLPSVAPSLKDPTRVPVTSCINAQHPACGEHSTVTVASPPPVQFLHVPGHQAWMATLIAKVEDCLVWLQPDHTRQKHWT